MTRPNAGAPYQVPRLDVPHDVWPVSPPREAIDVGVFGYDEVWKNSHAGHGSKYGSETGHASAGCDGPHCVGSLLELMDLLTKEGIDVELINSSDQSPIKIRTDQLDFAHCRLSMEGDQCFFLAASLIRARPMTSR